MDTVEKLELVSRYAIKLKRIVIVLILLAAAWITFDVYRVRMNNNRARDEFQAGRAAETAGDYKAAADHFSEVLKIDPRSAHAWCARGICRANLDGHRDALADFTKAIELQPDHKLAFLNRGVAYVRLGDRFKAISDFTEAVRIDPQYADAYHNRGAAYIDIGESDKAACDFATEDTLREKR